MKIDVTVETALSQSARVLQLSAMFDVPPEQKCKLTWSGDLPIDDWEWHVGLIVGPSGCGKSSILRDVFGKSPALAWGKPAVIDDFARSLTMEQITSACQAVGFNTIPAWMRPYHVLSNGEKFRVELARRLVESTDMVVIDEFTSVVDRQVAQIASHAVQKTARRMQKHLVVATCHYDVIEWLQPDWVLEPSTMTFTRRLVQRRPALQVEISRVPFAAWQVFAPFHYLTRELNRSAKCYGLWCEGTLASFVAMLHRPHPTQKTITIFGIARHVTLPDWQGIGLGMIIAEKVAAAYSALGYRVHGYPAHPILVQGIRRRPDLWKFLKQPGTFSPRQAASSANTTAVGKFGGRPNATTEWIGPKLDVDVARRLVNLDFSA